MSTIQVPAAGYAPSSVIALAAQAKTDVEAIESPSIIAFPASVAGPSITQAQNENAAGTDMTIAAQQGASGFSGGGLVLRSGAGGELTDLPGVIALDMGFGGGQGGSILIDAGSEGTVMSVSYAGSSNVNVAFASTAINATTNTLALSYDGTSRIKIGVDGIGFFNATPASKPTVSGSRANPEAALASLLAGLSTLGLITDSTTAS